MSIVITLDVYKDRCNKYGFTPVSPYFDIKSDIQVSCNKHNVIFTTTFDRISKCKCPECYKENNENRLSKYRLTNESVDVRIEGGNIKRVGNVVGRHVKIEWCCKTCQNTWTQTPGNILHNKNPTGCPVCNGGVKDTKQSFLQKMSDRKDIILIGEYVSSQKKTEFKCNKCDFVWESKPHNILIVGRGCPVCKLKSEKLVGDILIKNGYKVSHAYYVKSSERNFLIDWYIKDMKIAVEYHGKQHYEPVQFGGIDISRANENFSKQLVRDESLRQYCKINGINLIEIDGRKYNYRNVQKLEEIIINNVRGI